MSSSAVNVIYEQIYPEGSVTSYARFVAADWDQTPLQQSDVSSITCTVNKPAGSPATPSVVVADVIFDTLQTWDEDSVGYNFAHTVSGELANPGRHTIVYELDLGGGVKVHLFVVVDVLTELG